MGSGAVIPEAAQGSARLLEALEKLAEWAGSGPGGNGPSGPPSEDVVRAFEEALAGPSEGAEAEAAEMVDAGNASVPRPALPPPGAAQPRAADPGRNPQPPLRRGKTRSRSSPTREDPLRKPGCPLQAGERIPPDRERPVRELGRLLDEFSRPGANIGPDALFRAQYLAGMLRVQAQTGLKTSQSASQGMESVLRQQG